MDEVVVWSDGGARGNPGPAGYGVVVTDREGTVLAELSEGIGWATNNVAEYQGVIAGLRQAGSLGATRVVVRADSLGPRVRVGWTVVQLRAPPGDPGRGLGARAHDGDPRAARGSPPCQRRHPAPGERPARGEEQHQTEQVGQEPGHQQQRSGDQDHRAVGDLPGGDPTLGHGELEAPPGGQPLALGQPGAADAEHQQQEQRSEHADALADRQDHRQLRERDQNEQNHEHRDHDTSFDTEPLQTSMLLVPRQRERLGASPGSWQNEPVGESDGRSRSRSWGSRKVRPPQGRVLANGQSG